MSRTKHKYLRLFVCYGDNRDYYKKRRRKIRRKNSNSLRTLLANYTLDDVNDKVYTYDPPKDDQWNEPTDGHWAVTIKDAPRERYSLASDHWYNAKIRSKLKNP